MTTDGNGGQQGPENQDGNHPERHDVASLRLAQREARTVLDHQIQTFADIDDKAARTFRLDVVLLGLFLTAVTFLTRSDSLTIDPYVNPLTIVSVVAIIVSFVFAVVTYSLTGIETGIGPGDVERLVEAQYSEGEWLILLLRSEAGWMRENEHNNRAGARYLTISHAALIVGVLCAFFGATLANAPP